MRTDRDLAAVIARSLAILCVTLSSHAVADTTAVQPSGESAQINTTLAKETMQVPAKGSAEQKPHVKVIPLQPSGEYARIDTTLEKETMQVLARASAEQKLKVITQIKKAPDKYAPPVFYLLSNVLFQKGDKDEGAFWFYAGQLRARFDANRCADLSARAAVQVLNEQYGHHINEYTFHNLPMLEELIPKVVEWDKKTAHNYDHRWINLHGMNAVISGMGSASTPTALSLPKEQWEQIAEQTRSDYLSGFRKAMEMMKGPGFRKAMEMMKSREAHGK